METNAPGEVALAEAQPKKGKLKRHIRTTDEKWWFYQLTQQEPNLAPTVYISKFNAQFPNPLASSTAYDWMQSESIVKLKKLYALNAGKRAKDRYIRSRPVECEKLETALFHWFQGQSTMVYI
jgi:hypothetical protein